MNTESSVAISARPSGIVTLHGTARFKGDQDGRPAFSTPYVQTLALAPSSVSSTCRCGRRLDSFGHHRAACAEAGVLGRRGFPLEWGRSDLP